MKIDAAVRYADHHAVARAGDVAPRGRREPLEHDVTAVRVVHVEPSVRRVKGIEGHAKQSTLEEGVHAIPDVEKRRREQASVLDDANAADPLDDEEPSVV